MYDQKSSLRKIWIKKKNDLHFLKISVKQWIIEQRFKTFNIYPNQQNEFTKYKCKIFIKFKELFIIIILNLSVLGWFWYLNFSHHYGSYFPAPLHA